MKKKTKKGLRIIIGLLLIIGTWAEPMEQLKYLTNWTGEMAGYNSWIIMATFGGIYLIYSGIKKK
ncbi:MAG: hypothetical protein ACP6IY_19505 [Promethearchaeia archaeon]